MESKKSGLDFIKECARHDLIAMWRELKKNDIELRTIRYEFEDGDGKVRVYLTYDECGGEDGESVIGNVVARPHPSANKQGI